MVSFSRRGDSGKVVAAEDSKEHAIILGEDERKLILVAATVGLVVLALLALALSGSGTSLDRCKGILIQSQKNLCLEELAGSTENAPICGMITVQEEQYSCLVGIAEAKANISLCNEVNRTDALYPQCVLNVSMSTGNESYCQLLNDTYQSSCVFNLSRASKFSSLAMCNRISNKSIGRECAYLHYYGSALDSGSPSNCIFLPNETNYTVMSLMLNSNLTNYTDTMKFAYMSLNTSPRNYCYYDLAVLTGNSMGCSRVNGVLNGVCNAAFTHLNATLNITNVTAFCSMAKNQGADLSDLCVEGLLTSAAIATRNISKCMQIPLAIMKYNCITDYAINYTSASYCSYIDNSTVAQECYISVTNGTIG